MNILFICHGNICRSPMGEFILKDMLKSARLDSRVSVESKACSYEETGNPIYPPARSQLKKRGIPFTDHRAERTEKADYALYDIIVCMDDSNLRYLSRIYGGDPEKKVHLCMEYAGEPGRPVSDPWYTGDFDIAYLDIKRGCEGLLNEIKRRVPR